MKVRDALTALAGMPMDDNFTIRIRLGEDHLDLAVVEIRHENDVEGPHTVAEPESFIITTTARLEEA